MIESLIASIPLGNKRHPVAYYRMLDTLSDRMTVAQNKFVQASIPRTSGIELLKFMLLNFNDRQALSYEDDTTLFTELVESYQDEFRSAFDPVWTKTLSYGKFFRSKSGVHPAEFLLNCSLANPAVDLPFGEDWPSWHGIRAVEIIYHNSLELPIDLWTGYVTFLEKPPTFVVIAIDVPVLLMKWFKYTKFCKANGKEADELEFLKGEEYDQFFFDLMDIWLTNVMTRVVSHPESADKIYDEIFVPSYITSEQIIRNGITALNEQIRFLNERAIKLSDFIDTMWFSSNQSIRDKILSLGNRTVLPMQRQYQFLNVAKNLPYLKMLVSIINQDPENPRYNQLIRRAYNLYVKNIKFAHLPSYQYSNSLKTFVLMCCKEFDQIFEGKIDAPTEIIT